MFKRITILLIGVLCIVNLPIYAQNDSKPSKKRLYEEILGGEASKVKQYSYLYDTSLIQAIKKQDVDRIKFLLLANVNANERNDEGDTPLSVAITYPSEEIVRMLLDRGARVNEPSKNNVTPLMTVAALGTGTGLNILLDYGANPDLQDNQGRTALMYAVEALNYDTASALLDVSKMDLSIKDKNGKTAFAHVLDKQDADMLTLFNAKGVKIDSRDKTIKDLFFKSVKNNDENMVRTLVSCGYKVDSDDTSAKTAFINSVKNNRVEMAEIFLQAGIDPNSKDNTGVPALSIASKNNNLDMATVLLENKANPNARDNSGKTPVSYAIKNNNDDMVQLLLSYGKKKNTSAATDGTAQGKNAKAPKGSKGAKNSNNQTDTERDYAIDFSNWQTEDIEDYVARSEYNVKLAKKTLATRRAQDGNEATAPKSQNTAVKAKNTGAVASNSTNKTVSKPKATQSNGQKNVQKNNARSGQKSGQKNVKATAKKIAPKTQNKTGVAARNSQKTGSPSQQSSMQVLGEDENIDVLIATEGAPEPARSAQKVQPVQQVQQTQNDTLPEGAAEFPQMQPNAASGVEVDQPTELVAPAAAQQEQIVGNTPVNPATNSVTGNNTDTEDENPYAF